MAKAKKLPSGNWRVRVYSHTDPTGKKVYESVTAPSRTEAELAAAVFATTKHRKANNDLTVAEAIEQYVSAKEGVLSPSTLMAYRSMQKSAYGSIGTIRLKKLTPPTIQYWVSETASRVSAKTVKNAYGLLLSSLRLANAGIPLDGITLPTYIKKRHSAPSDGEIVLLYNEAPQKLKVCIALAAFCSLRRGEVCALKHEDVIGNKLHVHSDLVYGKDGWVHKDYPKTSDSIRHVTLPDEVIRLIGNGRPNDYISGYTPRGLSAAFDRLRKRLGIDIRFHDLRHYFASIGAVLNVPDIYLASFGGWKQNSSVMKEVYQNKIIPVSDGYAKRMSDHFSSMIREAK